MDPIQYLTMLGAIVSLVGLAISGIMVSRAQQRRDQIKMRLSAATAGAAGPTKANARAILSGMRDQDIRGRGILGHLFGLHPANSALYPMKWWVVPLLMAPPAIVLQSVIAEFLGTLSWPAVTIGWLMLCRNFFAWIEARRRTQLLSQLPDALAMIVRAIRVGIPVMEAMRIVSRECPIPTAGEFARLVDQVAVGTTLDGAANELAQRSGLPEYRFFATSVSLQMQTGGTLSDTLEGLAEVIRKRAALKARGKALTAEARTSAIILAILPFGTGLMLYVVNPKYLMILFTTEMGNKLLGAAIVSLIIGLMLIRTLIRRSLPQ